VILETANGIAAVPLTSVTSASFKKPINTSGKTKNPVNSLAVSYISDGSGVVNVKYVTKGITWAPSYHVILHPDSQTKTVNLAAKAVVLNDSEGIVVEDLACVAGWPNIKFSQVLDPMTRDQSVNDFLQTLDNLASGGHGHQRGGRGVMSQQIMSNAYSPLQELTPTLSNLVDADDLHFYRFKKVSLPQKERTYLPIFDATLPYQDVYHCDVEPMTYNSYRSHQDPTTQGYQDVWHAIQLVNNTKHVWTTAPVMLTKGDSFIGQDTLDYTQIGTKALVNLTKALDVKVCFDESITGNKGTIQILGNTYQQDTVTGRFAIFNHKTETVTVQVKAKIHGSLGDSSVKPKTNIEQVSNDVANGIRKVEWEARVEPGKTFDIQFKRDINRR